VNNETDVLNKCQVRDGRRPAAPASSAPATLTPLQPGDLTQQHHLNHTVKTQLSTPKPTTLYLTPTPRELPTKRLKTRPSRRTQAAHLLCPAQSKTSSPSVRYSAARQEATCNTAPPYTSRLEGRRQCFERPQALLLSRRLTRALSAREGQQRKNRKLTKYHRPVRRSG
jgi:hypothetical protein